MQMIKYVMLFLVFSASTIIGRMIAKKYAYRLEELEDFKSAINLFKTKIKFTYEPIAEIFEEIAKNTNPNVGNVFKRAKENLQFDTAPIAWEKAIEQIPTNLNKEDKQVLKMLSKLLGQTDMQRTS